VVTAVVVEEETALAVAEGEKVEGLDGDGLGVSEGDVLTTACDVLITGSSVV